MIYFQLCAEVGEGLCILEVRPNNPVKTTGGDPIVRVSIFSSPVLDLPERGGVLLQEGGPISVSAAGYQV